MAITSSSSTIERNSSDIYLVDYFIYCPLLCEKEGQESRKILYYYPATVDLDQQVRRIGYCEGLVKFTETFGFDQACDAVHFQKTRLLFYQAEQDLCLAMTIHVPVIERKNDETVMLDYRDEYINDRLMLPILKMSYRYFVFQQGLMSITLEYEGLEKLKNTLKNYFDKFIEYHLHEMIEHATLNSTFFGLELLPIERNIYIKIQSILRRFELIYPSLKQTFCLYRDQIIWSGLNPDDTTLLYSIFRRFYWKSIKTLPCTSAWRYLTVDSNVHPIKGLNISNELTYQEVYLQESSMPHRIIVINCNFLTIFCIFYFNEYLPESENFSSTIESLRKYLTEIFYELEDTCQQKDPIIDQTIKTIYFDKINMAQTTTFDWSRESSINSNTSVMNTLAEDLQWFESTDEIMVKRENDPWIIAKRSDMQELIISINQKNANLKDVQDRVKQLFAAQFNNILLLK